MNMRESIPLMLLAAILLAGCAGPQALTEADELARFGQHRVEIADMREHLRVGRRIRSRRATAGPSSGASFRDRACATQGHAPPRSSPDPQDQAEKSLTHYLLRGGALPSAGVYVMVTVPAPGTLKSVALYWSP